MLTNIKIPRINLLFSISGWLSLALMLAPIAGIGQTIRCGTDQVNDPVPKDRARKRDLQPDYDVGQQRYHVLPVVVHVVHDAPINKISKSLVKSQIEALNDDFGRAEEFKNVEVANGADTRIRFCLANKNPEGKATNGITYTKVQDASVQLKTDKPNKAKQAIRWPTDRYMNIWVVREIKNNAPNRRIQGFAFLPPNAANSDQDGIVMNHRYFGKNNPRNTYFQEGRVCTHEVGHYLNLFHPWGPTPESGCNKDDRVDDTPLCKGPFQKVQAPNPCEPDPVHECPRFDRMTSNFMEYSIDRCMKAFTAGQRKRMRNAITEYRSKLVSFSNMINTGCIKKYDDLNSRDTFNTAFYPKVNAFPNPADQQVFINTLAKSEKVLSASLMTMQGQTIRRPTLSEIRTGRINLNVSDLKEGIYILRVTFGNTVKQQEIVIQH